MNKSVWVYITFAILFLAGCGSLRSGTPMNEPKFEVLNTFEYVKDTGISKYHYITILVQNTGNSVITRPRLNLTLHQSGIPIQWDDVIVYPSRLEPGQRGAAVQQLGKLGRYDKENIKIIPGGFRLEEKKPYTNLELHGTNWEREKGFYRAFATFKNTGTEQAGLLGVRFIFYTSDGRVVTSGVGHLIEDGKGVAPGEIMEARSIVAEPFDVEVIAGFEAMVDYG